MKQKTIRSFDGTAIHYIINRIRNNTDSIIFIHGAGSNHTVYKPFFNAFESHNFIALDLRNHGKSGKAPLETITIQHLSKDVEAIIREERIANVILFGNSLGATIALEFYKNNRKKVKNMILFTLFSKRYIRASPIISIVAMLAYLVVRPFSGWRTLAFQDYHKYKKRPIWYYPLLDIRGTPIGTVIKAAAALFSYHLSLSSITIPTLLFVCLDDFSTKNSLIQSDCRENKYITLINIESHHVPLTRNYEEIVRHVKRFVEE